jgi:hypothetical protein
MTVTLRRLLLTCLVLAGAATDGAAQRVEVRGRGDIDNDAFLRSYVQRPGLIVLARDTLIGRADTVRGPVLIVDATVRLEGVAADDVVIVDGNLFLRPTAVVLGTVRNIAGGYYPSELAEVAGGVRSEPNAAYRSDRVDDAIVITGLTRESALVLDGLSGLRPPTYDRVDGVTLAFGAGLLLPRIGRLESIVRGHVAYRSQRGVITGGAELAAERGLTSVAVGAERTTDTRDRWMRGDALNSLTFLFIGTDYRDYYAAERAYATVRRTAETGPRTLSGWLRLQVEDASPLAAGSPWTLFGSPRPDNIAVEASRIASAAAGLRMDLTHSLHAVRAEADIETAIGVLDADHEFSRYTVDAAWEMAALASHTLGIRFHFQGPLPGTTSLPPQRWSFIGESATLPTFPFAEFRGDRVAFVATEYSIPLPPHFRLRFLGTPSLDLLHAVGMAWTADDRPPFEQNIGASLRYSVVFVRAITNPRNFADDVKYTIGLTLPRRDRPWQEPR